MKNQHFGIEIEFTGITRSHAADIVAQYFSTSYQYIGGGYSAYEVKDQQDRQWKLVFDSSIKGMKGRRSTADRDYKCELVSPICDYEDIEHIQQIVRNLREADARVNDSCGIHVHVDASRHDARTLRNITNIMYSKEDLLYKALGVQVSRQFRYCNKVDERFIQDLNRKKPKSLSQLQSIWYEGRPNRANSHYDNSRYHALNLHSVFSKGTIEFRLFNGTLHAGKIKSYIQLSLAISHQALTQTKSSRIKTQSTNEKYTFRTWLLRLGLIGSEFKTARTHLLSNLEGCIAWKNPNQALEQKERLRMKRESEATTVHESVQEHDCSDQNQSNNFEPEREIDENYAEALGEVGIEMGFHNGMM